MKNATIIKTGYSSGVYGNTGEYFTVIYTTPKGLKSFKFNGQYGVESRIRALFEDKGYTIDYCQADYGKLTRKEIMKNNYNEHIVKQNFEELFKNGYLED